MTIVNFDFSSNEDIIQFNMINMNMVFDLFIIIF
jgi:hypothetical protein